MSASHSVTQSLTTSPRRRWLPAALVVLLWAFHSVGVYLWLSANQFAVGWDRPKHLVSTLIFDEILRPVNIVTLFQVFSLNIGYYPPLFPLSAVPLYRIFGTSADVAAMVNVIYMLILLLSLYGIGARLYDVRTGLLAAFLGSMSPFLFSMAHYTYIDYALTAMTTLAVYTFFCSDRFRNTTYSVLFGVTLGLAMLYKWTPILFVSGPLALTVGSMAADSLRRKMRLSEPGEAADNLPANDAGLLLRAERGANSISQVEIASPPCGRLAMTGAMGWIGLLIRATVAIAAGLSLTWLWYSPNADLAATLFLGNWLPALSVLLISAAVFSLLLPARPWLNLLKSLALAALITSFWYLPRADMFRDIVSIVAGGRADRPNFLSPSAYVYYPLRLIEEGLGWPLFILAAVLSLSALVRLVRGMRRVSISDAKVLLWLVVPFIVATFSTHREVRSVLPLMSPIVIVAARLFLGVPRPDVRRVVVAGVSLFLLAQFAVLNVSALAVVAEATQISLPLLGRIGLFAQGEHIAWPDRGEHDSRYWIVPDVLQTITADLRSADANTGSGADAEGFAPPTDRQTTERDVVVLGLLLNSRSVNEYNIAYLVRTEYPEVKIKNLCQNRDLYPGYARLFECDYLLMRDQPDSSEPAGLVRTLLNAPPPFFSDHFSLHKTYLWPDGEQVYLFKNRTHAIPDRFGAEWLAPIGHAVEVNLSDTLRLLGYNVDTGQVASQGKLVVTLYWMGLKPTDENYTMHLKVLNGVRHVWGEQQGRPRWDASFTSRWARGEVVEDIREIPIWPGTPPGSYSVEVLVSGVHGGLPLEPADGGDLLLGPIELPAGPTPDVKALEMDRALNVRFGEDIVLLGYKLESGFRRGDGVHLTLYWQALGQMDQDYVVFNHLVGENGVTYAQKDNPPADGYYPTSRWAAGQVVRDRYDLFIPADAPAQWYNIETGLYLPATGQRLAVSGCTGDACADGDKVTLYRFEIMD